MKIIDESAIDVAYLLSKIDDLEMEIKEKNLKLKQMSSEINIYRLQNGQYG